MINWEKSAKINDTTVETLQEYFVRYPKSNKRVVVICERCGEEREVRYDARKPLCGSCARSGKNHPMYGRTGENNPLYGKHHTKETRKKMSEVKIGKYSGENNPRWKGGISFGKYCKLFNKSFKNSVRDSYHNTCYLCGKTKEEEGKNLAVHHVNYNKDCLCGSTCEFVPLCASCHAKTNNNRQYWEDLIMHYLHPNRYFMTDI